jgi:hypothetical protein
VRQRFRRDASVQNYAAALAEAARLMRQAAQIGMVEGEAPTGAKAPPPPAAATPTYRAFVEGAFDTLYMPRYRPATARRYRELHAQRVMAFLGDKPLDDIGPGDYRAFAAALRTDGVHTKGALNLVRSVMRAAVETGALAKLPVFPRGLIAASRKIPDAPTADDVDAMLEAGGWLGTAIALAALAGMRMGEVRALEVRDIDFEQHRILVRRALSEEASLTPKSGHERVGPPRHRPGGTPTGGRSGQAAAGAGGARRGPHAATAAGVDRVQAAAPQASPAGALLPLAASLLHHAALTGGSQRRGGPGARGSLYA